MTRHILVSLILILFSIFSFDSFSQERKPSPTVVESPNSKSTIPATRGGKVEPKAVPTTPMPTSIPPQPSKSSNEADYAILYRQTKRQLIYKILEHKDQLKEALPTLSDYVFEEDERVINGIYPLIFDKYFHDLKSGESLEQIIFGAWDYLRIRKLSLNQSFTYEQLYEATKVLNKVLMVSNPDEADIYIDGKPSGYKTNNPVWIEFGKHVIEFRKNGYSAIADSYTVAQNGVFEFNKSLNKLGPMSEERLAPQNRSAPASAAPALKQPVTAPGGQAPARKKLNEEE